MIRRREGKVPCPADPAAHLAMPVAATDPLIRNLSVAVLVLVFVVYNRRREAHIKYPGPDDDVRENIINYDDEGGGEDDMTAFDITPLQIPVGGPLPEMGTKIPCEYRHFLLLLLLPARRISQ